MTRRNPFKSQAQRRKFYAMEARGEIPKGTTARWERETRGKKLPERVNPKRSAAEARHVKTSLRIMRDDLARANFHDPKRVVAEFQADLDEPTGLRGNTEDWIGEWATWKEGLQTARAGQFVHLAIFERNRTHDLIDVKLLQIPPMRRENPDPAIWIPEEKSVEDLEVIQPMSLVEAEKQLRHPEGIAALISIGDIGSEEPEFVEESGIPALRIEFDDEWQKSKKNGPNRGDVVEIIKFIYANKDAIEDGEVLVIHCNMGWSRSTAAALIAWSILLGPGHEEEAMEMLEQSRPSAAPNRLMIEYADRFLGLGGRLVEINEARHADNRPRSNPAISQEDIEDTLARLKVSKGGEGQKIKINEDWSVGFYENLDRQTRETHPYTLVLFYRGKQQRAGLKKTDVFTKSKGRWARDKVWRLTPETINRMSRNILGAVKNTKVTS